MMEAVKGGRPTVGEVVTLLERNIYTYPQVDRVLGLTDGTALRWLNGYRRKRTSYPPILRSAPKDTKWVTWGEFVETRLFAGYRDIDRIPVSRLRRVVEVLRERFDQTYPLAHAAPYLQPDGKRMLWQAQEDSGLTDMFAMEVETGQMVLAPWVAQFVEAADFDGAHEGEVSALRPDPDFPAIKLDPSLRSGEPVVDGHNVRVATIASLVRGGEDETEVADWYQLTVDDVRQAVQYDRLHARIA
jgi:uncharacterized protein (DUF433 family)